MTKTNVVDTKTVLVGLILLLSAIQVTAASLKFEKNSYGSYSVDTGEMKGTLRDKQGTRWGPSRGFRSVVHTPTNVQISRNRGWLGHYRFLTTDNRLNPDGWDWDSKTQLLDDGTVQAKWMADKEHPFDMTAIYRFVTPSIMEVETEITAKEKLEKFQLVQSSYFGNSFNESRVYTSVDGVSVPEFVEVLKLSDAEVAKREKVGKRHERAQMRKDYKSWYMFPSNNDAWETVMDGRWNYGPYPLGWIKMSNYAEPLALRKHDKKNLYTLTMANPDVIDTLGIPHTNEPHRSNYFVFFGDDIQAGQTVKALLRIVIDENITKEKALDYYKTFLETYPYK